MKMKFTIKIYPFSHQSIFFFNLNETPYFAVNFSSVLHQRLDNIFQSPLAA